MVFYRKKFGLCIVTQEKNKAFRAAQYRRLAAGGRRFYVEIDAFVTRQVKLSREGSLLPPPSRPVCRRRHARCVTAATEGKSAVLSLHVNSD